MDGLMIIVKIIIYLDHVVIIIIKNVLILLIKIFVIIIMVWLGLLNHVIHLNNKFNATVYILGWILSIQLFINSLKFFTIDI